jgi:5-methyltetrahydrofolate--homocysteine methyltransferase
MTHLLEALSTALRAGDRDRVEALTHESLAAGVAPADVLNSGLLPGMKIVGDQFRDHELFLPDVLLAARAMSAAMEVLRPRLIAEGVPLAGRCVLGTVKGDLHDIGKNLVAILLQGAGFEVIDLGVDVEPSRFIDAALAHSAPVVGMSALLTTTMTGMREVVAMIAERGLRDRIRTIVGGAPLSAAFAAEIGADAYAPDAASAVERIRALVENG